MARLGPLIALQRAAPFTNRVGLMFVTKLGGYDGSAFPSGKAAVPIVTPHPPDVMAVGAVLIHSRPSPQITPTILQPRCGFFATKLRPKLCVPEIPATALAHGSRHPRRTAASSAVDDHTANGGDRLDGEHQP